MMKMDRALVVVVAVCLTQCHGLASKPRYLFYGMSKLIIQRKNFTPEFLETHNKARAAVGVAPLKWSPSLEKAASDVAWSMINNEKGCHSLDPRSLNRTYDIGSFNLYWDRYRRPSPREVVDKWVAEKKYYNHDKNSCVRNSKCGSYTQVVWRNSLELGCAQQRCHKWLQSNGITLCLYSPPGNVPGQRPF
ncbi:hypothetical protein RchiOBHm_Chr2g0103081 [Rosa chinensis]|uniref:SCP domain-containing protein n=1 Tax=Rosa chinensis TaxID=74649 RepID=A0A2P6RMT9_ROSCH|nr:hypothetical protein RchiOBHm_Chr2g0103081 [Rosa chinensis]